MKINNKKSINQTKIITLYYLLYKLFFYFFYLNSNIFIRKILQK